MTKTIFPLLAGAIPTQTLEDFSFSRSSEVALDDVSNIPDAPNIVTIKDDSDCFVTVIYNSLVGNVISDLEYNAGDSEHIFPAGSYVSRCYTTYDHEALVEHADTKVPSYQGIEVSGKLLAVGIDGYVTLVDQGKGTLDYNELSNKPMINSVPLIGNKTGADVGVVDIVEGSSLVPDEKVDAYDAHIIDVDNPHTVTKEQVGLGNVDNTADVDKPISDAVQEALDTKADVTDFDSHVEDTDNPHSVTKEQVGLGNADNTADLDKPISTLTQAALDLKATAADLESHIEDVDNPHSVTKSQVGLGNVDNTSDVNKPISTATQAALDLKADDADLTEHVSDTDNPHEVTASQVGLGNVDNTSDLDKPISTLTQTALNAKVDKVEGKSLSENDYTDEDKAIVDAVTDNLATKVDKATGMGLSQNSYTDAEKTKLAGIAAGAEVNVQADWTKTDTTDDSYIKNKPTALKNPQSIKFTGAVTTQYDGESEVTVNIPVGSASIWGDITGDIENQTDLYGALLGKVDAESGKSLVDDSKITEYDEHIADSDIHVTSTQKTEWSSKQNQITQSDKLSSDLVDDSSATNKFVTESDISSWNGHIGDTNNPHGVTKSQVGLGNVDNTSDVSKPISSATQTALDNKVDKVSGSSLVQDSKVSLYDAHIIDTSNPHSVTKSQVGLGSVDNTSDLDKPLSTAVQTALSGKVDTNSEEMEKLNNLNTSAILVSTQTTIQPSSFSEQPTPDVSGYPFRALISVANITADYFAVVVLSQADASSGNLSNICSTTSSGIYIYSKTQPSVAVVVESISAWKTL